MTPNRRVLDPAIPATVTVSHLDDGVRLYYVVTGAAVLACPDHGAAATSALKHNLIHGHIPAPVNVRGKL